MVISILAALIALLLPALGNAREAARVAKCASNVRMQVLGLLQYAQDFRGWLPTHDIAWATSVGDFYYHDVNVPIWQWGLSMNTRYHQIVRIWGAGRYVPNAQLNVCPSLAAKIRGRWPVDAESLWTWTAATWGSSQLAYSQMALGKGDWRDYHLGGPNRPISYIGNSLGPLDVPRDQRRTGAFNIGDTLLPGVPFYDFLVRDGGNVGAWDDQVPFNHASGGGNTYWSTYHDVTGWNVGYPDGHVKWVRRQ